MSLLAPTVQTVRHTQDVMVAQTVTANSGTATSRVYDAAIDRVKAHLLWSASPSSGQKVEVEYVDQTGTVVLATETLLDLTSSQVSASWEFEPVLPRFRFKVTNKHTSSRTVVALTVGPANPAKDTHLTVARTEVVRYSKDNPLGDSSASAYEPRVVTTATQYLPHMWWPINGHGADLYSPVGVAEQSIRLVSTLDVPLWVQVQPIFAKSGAVHEPDIIGPAITLGTMPASDGTTWQQWWMVPERDTLIPEIDGAVRCTELRVLRGNYPAFLLRMRPESTPTSGEWAIDVARRFI